MAKNTNILQDKPIYKIIGLIWLLLETNLLGGNIFGFGSLFGVLPRYDIYNSRCTTISEKVISNETTTLTKDCRAQVDEYQLAFALGIGFYNLPAVFIGMVIDFFGARTLKLIGIVFHLIGWLALGFIKPGYDWLLFIHTIFASVAQMCVLLSSFTISSHFTETRGLVSSLISGAQLGGSIWYAIFQMLIQRNLASLSTLSFIWASLSVFMFGSSILFLDWRCKVPTKSKNTEESTKADVAINSTDDSLVRHLKNPIFIVVTLFLGCLLLTVSFLPVVWFPWVMYLTGYNLRLANLFTFMYNMSAAVCIFVSPICGYMIDFKNHRGPSQRLLNVTIVQLITWLLTIVLCIVCMFRTMAAPILAICIFIFSRTMLVTGCQAVITTMFPPQYIGTLLGLMWTSVAIISFSTYGLTRLAKSPLDAWRAWLVILILCFIMGGHVIQLWNLYLKSKKEAKNQSSINEEQMTALKSSIDS